MELDIGSASRFLPTPPAFDAPIRGVSIGILPWRMYGKPEWCGCPKVKKFWYDYSLWHNPRTWQTHTQTLHYGIGHGYTVYIASRGKNASIVNWRCSQKSAALRKSAALCNAQCQGWLRIKPVSHPTCLSGLHQKPAKYMHDPLLSYSLFHIIILFSASSVSFPATWICLPCVWCCIFNAHQELIT